MYGHLWQEDGLSQKEIEELILVYVRFVLHKTKIVLCSYWDLNGVRYGTILTAIHSNEIMMG